ncbi:MULTISPECIES: ALF repeat-containing protein [unclassified Streptomyces]|uniref:ALF repeat-containing protein n=1 Tax=unclassified Streptomyces TaxID=2593676 RepID=UPI00131C9F60|nr:MULTISPECIES: ALF repeat-containing protein [unclassified Streptomyces]
MKFSRIAAAVTTAALAPAVLIASPAFAAGPDAPATGNQPAPTVPDQAVPDPTVPDQAEEDRKTILAIIAHPMASEFMKEAGHKAIADGPKAMRKFIEVDQHNIRMDDYRIAILRLLPDAGPGLKEGVNKVLTHGNTIEKLRHFYDVTQHELRDDDNKVEISRLIGTGGTGVKEAGKKALKGTPADRAEFLKTGRHLAQAQDDLVELARIDEGWDGPILTAAISKLMNGSPTPAELRHFLEVTQYELRDQDNRVTIAKIIDGAGPELLKAGRAALAGTPADRTEFLKTGQHEARAKDQATKDKDKPAPGKDGDTKHNTTGTGGTTTVAGTGNTTVTAQGTHAAPLATTGAGDHTAMIAGGAGTALIAGAGLLLAARMRRAGAEG